MVRQLAAQITFQVSNTFLRQPRGPGALVQIAQGAQPGASVTVSLGRRRGNSGRCRGLSRRFP